MSRWDQLSLSEKNDLMGIYVKHGYTDLGAIRESYNQFQDGGFLGELVQSAKKFYNKNVRTSDLLSRIAPASFRKSFDASGYDNKDDAYRAARSGGYKTFVWQGDHYNTDYSGDSHKVYQGRVQSGEAQRWSENNPGMIDPYLKRAKQEELDTYGITNEQTRDRTRVENSLLENQQYYHYDTPVRDFIDVIRGKKQEDREAFDTYISEGQDDDYFRQTLMHHKDLFRTLLGAPQENKTLSISDYKPTMGGGDPYYYRVDGISPAFEDQASYIDSVIQGDGEYGLEDMLRDTQGPRGQSGMSDEAISRTLKRSSKGEPFNIVRDGDSAGMSVLGAFTHGVSSDYHSYSDEWDLNPFGQGKAPSLVGKPFSLYDRVYKQNK